MTKRNRLCNQVGKGLNNVPSLVGLVLVADTGYKSGARWYRVVCHLSGLSGTCCEQPREVVPGSRDGQGRTSSQGDRVETQAHRVSDVGISWYRRLWVARLG